MNVAHLAHRAITIGYMAFNHYAKMKQILADQPAGWYVVRINEPTIAQSFRGEKRTFSHYYRVHNTSGKPIKFCKFQQLDRFCSTMGIDVGELVVVDANHR